MRPERLFHTPKRSKRDPSELPKIGRDTPESIAWAKRLGAAILKRDAGKVTEQ